ncbi:hypothetical protein HRbin40_00412 [bacterium HR40]|nr:hypothetical protein HRbin40_00412 [bacterium HR40]
MDIYLPIAEISVNFFLILGLGLAVGWLSGLFGIGGGFVMTPLLIFVGIPPAVAVATQALQILASSFSSTLSHMRHGTLDVRMGAVLVLGGLCGSFLGVWLFRWLRELGQIDAAISLGYVLFMGSVGVTMAAETLSQQLRRRRGPVRRKLHRHSWLHRLPLKMRFPTSRLYISAITPLLVGLGGGMLSAVLGIGGGFVLIPAMIYLIGMPTAVVIGTSHFQITFVAALTALLHAWTNQTVDVVLGLLMILGGVVGAQFGTRAASRLPPDQVRGLFAGLVLLVAGKLLYDLVAPPADPYDILTIRGPF